MKRLKLLRTHVAVLSYWEYGTDMLRTVIKRILQGLFVALCVTFVTFILIRLIPGDPAKTMSPLSSEEQLEILREELGLTKPIPTQFVIYLKNVFQGNLGDSYFEKDTVIHLLERAIPKSAYLMINAILVSVVLGITLGTLAAFFRGKWGDSVLSSIAVLFQSFPNYWVALMMILIFSVRLGWFPAMDFKGFKYTVLPSLVLALPLTSSMIKNTRSLLVDSYGLDFVKAAHARGLGNVKVYFKYAFRNTLLSLITTLGNMMGSLIGGIVCVEYIFSYPGLGYTIFTAITKRDYNLIQGIILVTCLFFVAVNLVIDLSYPLLDPRIKKAQGGFGNE